jgi:serine protease Do
MAQTTVFSTSSSLPLPDVFSSAVTEIFKAVQPGIVQVRTQQRGGGTGVIWQRDGRIITNHHVVSSDAAKVQVLLADGRTLDARVLHRNQRLDLAMLKVDGAQLTALPVGNSSALRVGEWVFAIGHPWGQRWALTAGIVSRINTVKLANDLTTQYIQSDVRLAPGNSGGPLLDADGKVIGINAMIFGGDLSVAIPSDVVSSWIAGLPQGRVALGVEIQPVEIPTTIRQQLEPQRDHGLLVVSTKGRPSYLNDLLVGDILLDIAGQPIADGATLRNILARHATSDTVPMKILRGGIVLDSNIVTQRLDAAA